MTKVLWVLCDDLGYGDFGCQGHPTALTPTVDTIAAAGTRFTHYRNLFSKCSSSRCTLLTGQSAGNYAIDGVDAPDIGDRLWLPSGATTVYRMLKTLSPAPWIMHVGKWHLGTPGPGNAGNRNTLHPIGFGADEFYGAIDRPNSTSGDFDRYKDTWVLNDYTHELTAGYITQVHASRICDRLDVRGLETDWMIAWWMHSMHEPLDNTIPEMSLYPSGGLATRTYYANLTHLDNALATVVAKLQALGIYDDVHIVISSDNGPPAFTPGSAGGLSGFKDGSEEGGIRVPMIWKGPGVPVAVDAENRLQIDFFPTVCDLFGVDASGWPGVNLFGAVPQRDQLFRANDSDALIRAKIGDGRTIKLLETSGSVRRFYAVDGIVLETAGTALTVVPSGAVAGQLNQADADSIEAEYDTRMAAYPVLPGSGAAPAYPGGHTESDARAIVDSWWAYEPRVTDYRVHMCGTTGAALQGALEALTQHPRDAACSHGDTPVTVAALGTLPTGTHAAYGASKVVFGPLHALCFYPPARGNCDAGELAEIDARLATTTGDRFT